MTKQGKPTGAPSTDVKERLAIIEKKLKEIKKGEKTDGTKNE